MVAVEVTQTTLAVIIGLFVLRVLERLLQNSGRLPSLTGALEFLIGP